MGPDQHTTRPEKPHDFETFPLHVLETNRGHVWSWSCEFQRVVGQSGRKEESYRRNACRMGETRT